MIEPEVAEERQTRSSIASRPTITERGGTWGPSTPWGKRKLAYEIDHQPTRGTSCSPSTRPEALDEATRVLAITDGVMRHMAVDPHQDRQRTAGRVAEPAEVAG